MKKELEPPPAGFDENPEWTEANSARAVPFGTMFPAQLASWEKNLGGRPKTARPKVHIGFRLSADVVAGVKATGKGYNARVERLLRDALAKGQL
jgi:uncharacterized protein (DUF4415 family)